MGGYGWVWVLGERLSDTWKRVLEEVHVEFCEAVGGGELWENWIQVYRTGEGLSDREAR